ncbi:MAG: hypothetical protein J7L22_08670 [Candidatus Marinimicrobia bacterium]|nr:hypothetical protein [Candidatus Neomarinimicrobiota bacterium]
MTRDILIGIILLMSVVAIISYLVMWSRNFINKISEQGADTARKIQKNING